MMTTMVILLALAAQVAEKPAAKHRDGGLFCLDGRRTLSQQADGSFRLIVWTKMEADLARATWAGGKPLVARTARSVPLISTGYEIPIAKDGRPQGRPQPFAISVSMARFSAGRPEPIESLRLKIDTGSAADIAEMPLSATGYKVAMPIGQIVVADRKQQDHEVALPRADFEPLVRAIENGERTIVLLQNGKELGRVPVPLVSLRGQTEETLAWTAKAAAAMTARKTCPAA